MFKNYKLIIFILILKINVSFTNECCVMRWNEEYPFLPECQIDNICKPVKILDWADDIRTKIKAVDEGLEVLRNIPGPVAIVTVVGRARSGKSFSLDRILQIDPRYGFPIGHTERPETTGAYIWPKPLLSSQSTSIMFIDTEGLGLGPTTYDKALLLMAMMTSSTIIYHASEYIYYDDITKLYDLACLIDHYSNRGIITEGLIDLPTIAWVVQKFNLLRNEDIRDLGILFDEWIAERPNPNDDQDIAQYNFTARLVRKIFPKHLAYLIPSANSGDVHTTQLDVIPPSKLAPEYVSIMKKLVDDLRTTEPKRTFSGQYRTGPEVATLIESLVLAANDKIDITGDRIVDAILEERATISSRELEHFVSTLQYPVDEIQLYDQITAVYNRLIDGMSLGLTGKSVPLNILSRASVHLASVYSKERVRADVLNRAASETLCSSLAEKYKISATDRFTSASTRSRPGIAQYEAIVNNALDEYKKNAIGPAHDRYFKELETKLKNDLDAEIIAEIPRRRISWLILCSITILLCHSIVSFTNNNVRSRVIMSLGVIGFFMEIISVLTVALILASWFSSPPFTFEDLYGTVIKIYTIPENIFLNIRNISYFLKYI